MKILVISLLRIGDVVLHEEIIKSIRRTHPLSHISCLVNDDCQSICGLIPDVDEWLVFPRTRLQNKMNQVERWILAPVLEIEGLLQKLKAQKFDQIVNLTHTVISGHICGYLSKSCRDVRGLCLTEQGKLRPDASQALQYMNSQWSSEVEPHLHYVEALSVVSRYPLLLQTSLAPIRVHKMYARLTFQITTSDKRKHFSLMRWNEIFRQIHEVVPEYDLQVLVSPKEEEAIARQLHRSIEVKSCSFSESLDLIEESDLFISHDTSLLHLAARTNTQIVQISTGSSHLLKTSSLKEGTLVLAAQTSCFPCRHQAQCHQPRLICQEDISNDAVLGAIQFGLGKLGHALPSRLSMVQIVDGLWWLQNKEKQRNFSHKKELYTSLGGHLKSEQFLMEAQLETNHSETSDLSFG